MLLKVMMLKLKWSHRSQVVIRWRTSFIRVSMLTSFAIEFGIWDNMMLLVVIVDAVGVGPPRTRVNVVHQWIRLWSIDIHDLLPFLDNRVWNVWIAMS